MTDTFTDDYAVGFDGPPGPGLSADDLTTLNTAVTTVQGVEATVTVQAADVAAAVASLTLSGTQIIGKTTDPVTGSAAVALAALFNNPVADSGYAGATYWLPSIKIWQLAAGSLTLYRYTKSGTTYTKTVVGTATLVSGNNGSDVTLTGTDFGLGTAAIPVSVSDYLALSGNSKWAANAVAGPSFASIDPTGATVSNPTFGTAARCEVQFNVAWSYQLVTTTNFAALQGIVASLQSSVSSNSIAVASLQQATTQQIGRQVDPVDAPAASALSILMQAPVAVAGSLANFKFYAHAAGNVQIGRATRLGTTDTINAVSNVVAVSAGLNTLTATGASDLGAFPVNAGDYLIIAAPGVIALTTSTTDDTGGWVFSNTAMTLGGTITAPSTLANARIEAQFNLTGTTQPVTAASVKIDYRMWRAIAEIVHFIIYGQSLARGFSAGLNNTSSLGYAARYVGGVRADDAGGSSATYHASIVGLYEQTSGSMGETQASGMAKMLKQLFLADGIDVTTWNRQWLFSAPGNNGTAASGLIAGTTPFGRLTDDITYGPAAAAAFGKPTYAPQLICYEQGQSDYAAGVVASTWKGLVQSIRVDAQSQARVTTGLTDLTLPMILTQISSHVFYSVASANIALAQTDLHAFQEYCVACPEYFLPPNTGNAPHLVANGYEWMGAYWALCFYNWIIKGTKPSLMQPTSVRRIGNSLIAKYPVASGKKLVVDTTLVAAQANYGFTCVDGSGSAVTLSNARLVSNDEIAVDCASTPAAGWKLRYGFVNTTDGTPVFGKGNIRDNVGDALTYVGSSNLGTVAMHTWALHSETVVV